MRRGQIKIALLAVGAVAITAMGQTTMEHLGLQYQSLGDATVGPGGPGGLQIGGMVGPGDGFAVTLADDTPGTVADGWLGEGEFVLPVNTGASMDVTAFGLVAGEVGVQRLGGTRVVAVDASGELGLELEVDLDTPFGGANGSFTLNLYAEGSLIFSRAGLRDRLHPNKPTIRARQRINRALCYLNRIARDPRRIVNCIRLAQPTPLRADADGDGNFEFEGSVDRIEVVFDPPDEIEAITRMELTNAADPAVGLPDLDVLDAALHVYDFDQRALGDAHMSADANGRLVVSNIGSSGLDGVSIDVGGLNDVTTTIPLPRGTSPCDPNGDGASDIGDLLFFLVNWFGTDPAADINGDGTTDVLDLLFFLSNCFFNPEPPITGGMQIGDFMETHSIGLVDGDPDFDAGFTRLERIDETTNGGFEYLAEADFNALGSPTSTVNLYDDSGALLDSFAAQVSGSICVDIDVSLEAELKCTWKSGRWWPPRLPGWEWTITVNGEVRVKVGASITANVSRIEWIPDGPVSTMEAYSRLDVLAGFGDTGMIAFQDMLASQTTPSGLVTTPSLLSTDTTFESNANGDLVVRSPSGTPALDVQLTPIGPPTSDGSEGWLGDGELLGAMPVGGDMTLDVYGTIAGSVNARLGGTRVVGVDANGNAEVDLELQVDLDLFHFSGSFNATASLGGTVAFTRNGMNPGDVIRAIDPGRRARRAICYARRVVNDPRRIIYCYRLPRPITVELEVDGSIEFSGQVDFIEISAEANFDIEATTRIEISGNNIPDIYIRRQKVRRFEVDMSANGNASLEVDASGSLVIRNIGSSGEDGVSIDVGGEASGATGVDVSLGPVDLSLRAGAEINVGVSGTFDFDPPSLPRRGHFGRVRLRSVDVEGQFEADIYAEFNAEFSGMVDVGVEGSGVFERRAAVGVVGRVRGELGSPLPPVTGCGKLPGFPPGGPPCFYLDFENSVEVEASGGIFIGIGSRLLLLSGDPVVTQNLGNITCNASDIDADAEIHQVVTHP